MFDLTHAYHIYVYWFVYIYHQVREVSQFVHLKLGSWCVSTTRCERIQIGSLRENSDPIYFSWKTFFEFPIHFLHQYDVVAHS